MGKLWSLVELNSFIKGILSNNFLENHGIEGAPIPVIADRAKMDKNEQIVCLVTEWVRDALNFCNETDAVYSHLLKMEASLNEYSFNLK
jgi:hypothetical protein